MCNLSKLSKFVSLPIYCEWLDVTTLCVLDCAWCSSIDRDQFLLCIQHENVKFEGLCESTALEGYLLWLTSRKLHIKQLCINRVLVKKVQSNCIACLTEISVLKIEEDSHLYRKGFSVLIQHCPNLLELHLSECRLLNDSVVNSIANSCQNLRMIYFPCISTSQNRVSDQSVVHLAKSCAHLQVVYFANFDALTNKAVLALVEHCPHLTELSIINIPNLTNAVLYSIAKHLPNLALFDVSNCAKFTSSGLSAVFKGCTSLQHFIMQQSDFNSRRNYYAAPEPMAWSDMAQLSLLQTLRLSNAVGMKDADVALILESCLDLTALDISYTQSAAYYQRDPHRISATAYEHIAKHCGNLTELHMPGPDKLPDSTMDLLILHGTKLRVVNFSDASFSECAVSSFIEKRGGNLKDIYLRRVHYISNAFLEKLFLHCPRLEKLDISVNSVPYVQFKIEYLRLDEFITQDTALKTLVVEGQHTIQRFISENTLEKLYAIKGLNIVG